MSDYDDGERAAPAANPSRGGGDAARRSVKQMDLPVAVIEQDHKLERATAKTSEQLAKLRWHWTLDETNPDRVSLKAYARGISRDRALVTKYAKGYASWQEGDDIVTLSEAIERAGMGAEREAATEAVAQARGLGFSTVKQSRPTEIKRVREIARERVEQHGGTIEEQAEKAAEWIVKAEKADARQRDERKERLGLRFVEMEEELDAVKRRLIKAVNLAHDVPWGDEERELLGTTLANVKALLELINLALVGSADVDWDAELADLTEA
jgi:hypothetical protein